MLLKLLHLQFISVQSVSRLESSAYDDLERFFLGGVAKNLVRVFDLIELKVVGNQAGGINLAGLHGLEQHRSGVGVNQSGTYCNVLYP